MTTTATQQPPSRVSTPRPKHSRTSSLQSEPAVAPKSRTTQGPVPSDSGALPQQTPGARRGTRAATADPLSDKATAFLIRRILCPQQADKGKSSPVSIEGLLPPLTSRNDVDLQLYALIAINLREYVQNWYAKITPDETFVAEILQIIAHITRALEQRLRKVDLESLLFDELPELLDKHITAYRVAHDPIAQPPVKTDPREIYHSLCPLPALSPVPKPEVPESVAVQAENEATYRQLLVSAFLAILLPTEDLENGCLTTLVGQILSELIIGNAVANKLSEPWLIWELLIIASRTARRRKETGDEDSLEQSSNETPSGRGRFSAHALLWTILQWCFLAFSFIRTAFAILMISGSLPPRTSPSAHFHKGATRHGTEQDPVWLASAPEANQQPSKVPVLGFQCWSAISNLAEMDRRMPWLSGALSMLQWIAVMGPGRIADVDGKLDRLLSYGINCHVLDAANLPPLLRSVRGALFPNNMPAGKSSLVPPASDAELLALRRRCASALWALIPKGVGRLFFAGRRPGGGGGGLVRRATSPVSITRGWKREEEKTEGSAQQLKTGREEVGMEISNQDKQDKDRGGRDIINSSSSSGGGKDWEEGPKGKAAAATAPQAQARGQEGSRSGSRPGQRSAPAATPRPKTGGQGSCSSSSGVGHLSAAAEASAGGGAMAASARRDGNDDDDRVEDDDEMILEEIERAFLDVFSDAYCNKHLVYSVVELVLVRLLPEIAEKGVLELWAERISVEEG
ncbi:hypothetical protein VTI74DRAFT_8196 [Chaetomium olivicolor]